jgi:hypothetical protein
LSGEVTLELMAHNFGEEEKKEVTSTSGSQTESSKSTTSKRIGPSRYQKGKKLAQGGFGAVYIGLISFYSKQHH